MANETIIQEIENLLSEIIRFGGANEQSKLVPNLEVINADPAGLNGYLVISDNRDGDNIIAKKVGSVIYANNDKVNVLFPDGGEAIAFQQGSESANNGDIWEIVPSTTTDIFYDRGNVGIGTTAPEVDLHILGGGDPSIFNPAASGELLALQNSNAAFDGLTMSLVSGASGVINIDFGTEADQQVGSIQYTNSTDQMTFLTGNSQRLLLGSTGLMVGGTFGSDARIEAVDGSGAQLRLSHTEDSKYVTFAVDTNHDLTITPTSNGQIILQPTTDSTDFLQVLDADGGNPVLNVDSTNERVGIGTAAPATQLHLSSATNMIIRAQTSLTNGVARFELINDAIQWNVGVNASDALTFFNATASKTPLIIDSGTTVSNLIHIGANFVVINGNGDDADFRLEGNNDANLIFANAGTDRVGIGLNSPSAKFHVDQASTTAAIPPLYLDQADVSEEMIEFNTTIGVGNAIEAIGAKTLTTTHFIKITIPGPLTRYIACGTIA